MQVPNHLAIIMDGNGRWAQKRKLPRAKGHHEGAKRVKDVVRQAKRRGVKVLTLFAFSTENWNRPKEEIEHLFGYLKDFLNSYKDELIENQIRLKIVGRRDRIKKGVLEAIEEVEGATFDNAEFFLNIALDYGGRWDIVNATKKITEAIEQKTIKKEQLNEKIFSNYVSLSEFGDPDILVRTSGEKRISNFIIWQTAYTEFYFPKVLWPDFDGRWVDNTIVEYSKRRRKFGNINA